MRERITTSGQVTIGLDLGDKWSEACGVDGRARTVLRHRVRTTRAGLEELRAYAGARVVIEAGTHSPWVSRHLEANGFEVIVANPRRVRLIAQSDSKSDGFDAEVLARLGRADAQLLAPIAHRSEAVQRDRIGLQVRDGLVRARTQLINQVRGFAKSLGVRLPGGSAETFAKRLRSAELGDLFPGCEVLLATIEQLSDAARRLERAIDRVGATQYPVTQRLRQVPGVGAITSLAFVLTLEDPARFRSSRAVGAYLGLRPRRRDSGERSPQLRITKAGDRFLRRLLVGSAQYVLGPFGPDTDLRRFGLRLAERGGKAAKKRAVVAVARKLAVLLHRMWTTGEGYVPVGYTRRAPGRRHSTRSRHDVRSDHPVRATALHTPDPAPRREGRQQDRSARRDGPQRAPASTNEALESADGSPVDRSTRAAATAPRLGR
jgi:transposase